MITHNNFSIIGRLLCVFTIFVFFSNNNYLLSEIKIISPTNLDSIFVNENVNIKWTNDDIVPTNVSLLYSTDDGENWHYIVYNIRSNNNTYSWKVPYLKNKNIKLKIETNKPISFSAIYENTMAHIEESRTCDFSSDGKYYLTSGDDGYFRIWNIASRSLYKEFKTATKDAKIYCAKFINGVDSVIFSADRDVYLWDINSNIEKKLFSCIDVAFYIDVNNENYASKDINNDILISCCSQGGRLYLYSLNTNSVIDNFKGGSADDAFYRCRFSHNGKYVAFVGYDKIVNLYNIETKELKYLHIGTGNANVIWGIDFSFDDNEIIIAGLDGYIRRIDVTTMQLIAEYLGLQNSSHIRSIRYINKENDFVSVSLGADIVLGSFSPNSDTCYKYDIAITDYQNTDINYYYNRTTNRPEYIGVIGREPREYGKFTVYRIDHPINFEDEINLNAYYKYSVKISDITTIPNKRISYFVNFTSNYDKDSIPFEKIPINMSISFPDRLLYIFDGNAENTNLNRTTYNYFYSNIINEANYVILARTLLGDTNYGNVLIENWDSENDMFALKINDGSITIVSDCEANANRNVLYGKASNVFISEDYEYINLDIEIASDDDYELIVTDLSGNIILNKLFNQSGTYFIELQKNKFSAGTYYVKLLSQYDGKVGKFIITK